MKLPDAWEPQPVDGDGKVSTMHMFEVVKDSAEYTEALQGFNNTIQQTVTVIKLERIQNPLLYKIHVALEDTVCEKYAKKKIDVRTLFHG